MKLLLDGKQRSIYFRKDNTVYYKIKNKEYEVSKEVLKKNKKLIKGGVKRFFGSDDLLKNIVIKQIDNKVWETSTIRNVYKSLLYVFILCKIEIETIGILHQKKDLSEYTKSTINNIIKIVLGKTYFIGNKPIKILQPISLITEENPSMYTETNFKQVINTITYKQITDTFSILDEFVSEQHPDTAFDKVTNVDDNKYNLDFLKHIMIQEGLFKSETVLLYDSTPSRIKDQNLLIFHVKTFDELYKEETNIYNKILYEADEALYKNIANRTIDHEKIEKEKERRAVNARTYLTKLESMNALINTNLTTVVKKTAELEKIKNIKKDYFTTNRDASADYLSVTYNKLIQYKLNDIEENIGAKLRTYISFREETIPQHIVIKNVEIEAKRNIVFDGTPYGNHSGIFENNGKSISNDEKFDKMKPLLSKLTKEPLAILIFGYGYSGSGKTYTLFGNNKAQGITHLAIKHFLSSNSTIEMDKVYELYNDKYDFSNNMKNQDPYPNDKSIYVYVGNGQGSIGFNPYPISITEFNNYYSPKSTTELQNPPTSIIKKVDIVNFKATYEKIMESRKSAILVDSTSKDSILNSSKADGHTYRIMATANNKESSRSHLFISLKITTDKIVSYLTICDMGGRENPNDLLLDTKIYNILYNVADWNVKCSSTNEIVNFPHIISKDMKSMYTLNGNCKIFGQAAEMFGIAYDNAKKHASDNNTKFVPPPGIPEDKGDAVYRKIKPLIYEIKEHSIDNRNDKYPGLLQSFKSFYARPAIYELLMDSTDYNILQGTTGAQQKGVLVKIATQNYENFKKRVPDLPLVDRDNGTSRGESKTSITRDISVFDATHAVIIRNFIHLFFKCVKQGFFINDTINQLLNKFSGELPYTPPPTKIIVNKFRKPIVISKKKPHKCVLDSLKEVNTADVIQNPASTTDDKKRANRAHFNQYGWHINSLPDSCIVSTVYDNATDVDDNKPNDIISNNIGESTYFQYDPEKVVPASKNHDAVPDHCVCLSSILENFCPAGVTKKYVVIGCLRSTLDFKPDDIATLKFLKAVSVSKLTKHGEEAPAETEAAEEAEEAT